MGKKAALISWRFRTFRRFGVAAGSGPSSKVRATRFALASPRQVALMKKLSFNLDTPRMKMARYAVKKSPRTKQRIGPSRLKPTPIAVRTTRIVVVWKLLIVNSQGAI
jgi:hypothetical protein